jgi:hypothetical protein
MARPCAALLSVVVVLGLGLRAQADSETKETGAELTAPRAKGKELEWVVLPYPFFTPETSAAAGVGAVVVLPSDPDAPMDRDSLLEFSTLLSIRKQFLVAHRNNIFLDNQNWLLNVDSLARVHWPDRFYPLGNDSGPDEFEKWTERSLKIQSQFFRRVVDSFYAGLIGELRWTAVDANEGGLLDTGPVPGNTDHFALGFGVSLLMDTRSNTLAPKSGGLYTAHWTAFDSIFGSEFDFTRLEVDLRHYVNPWLEHVLAMRLFVGIETGNPPFTLMERLGGINRVRGVHAARFVDRNVAFALLEYRFPIWWRFAGVAFVGFGQVARNLDGFGLTELHGTGGGGLRLRVAPEEPVYVSLDLAGTRDEFNLYFGIGHSF